MATTQPIRSKDEVSKLLDYFLISGRLRDHILVVLSIYTALRISDILRLNWNDVYDFERKCVRKSISITEKKTGKSKIIALNKRAVSALKLLAVSSAAPGHILIENKRTGKAISRIQAYRIIRDAAEAIAMQSRVSCHSLRKTFGYHAWKGGASPAVIMDIYNHSSLDVTKLYLGISQDDKNDVYMGLSF